MTQIFNLLLLLFLLLLLNVVVNAKLKLHSNKRFTRGVAPERLSHYKFAKEFRCLDSSGVIPFNRVNDDYCDCQDGSDEPGTAACKNSVFYCLNGYFRPHYVLSSRVNDGVCDCCDGSDEYSHYVTCHDVCKQLHESLKRNEEDIMKHLEEGHQRYIQYAYLGADVKAKTRLRLTNLQDEISQLEAMTSDLEKVKNNYEINERNFKLSAESKSSVDVPDSEIERKHALEVFQALDTDFDKRVSTKELVDLFQSIDDVYDQYDEKRYFLPEPVNFKYFVEVLWGRFREVYEKKIGFQSLGYNDYDNEDDYEEGDDDNDDDDDDDDDMFHDDDDDNGKQEYDDASKEAIEGADKARKRLKEHTSKLSELTEQLEQARFLIDLDGGPNNEFLPLYGRCFEFEEWLYRYTFCPFQYATQKHTDGSEIISMGKWDSWIGGEANKYSVMMYNNGNECWNGPKRSVMVHLECGSTEELVSVSEPGRCGYQLTFKTSASCSTRPPSSPQLHDSSDL